jgi:hypothetical protein
MSMIADRGRHIETRPGPSHAGGMKMMWAAGFGLALAGCVGAPDGAPDFGGGWMLNPPLSDAALARVLDTPGCPPEGWDRARLDQLKADTFAIAGVAAREAFAKGIVACLASPEPAVRDGIAFEALTTLLRGRQLGEATMRALLVDLTAKLEAPDPSGFGQSFAALALSEVARADRVQAFLTEEERVKLLVDAQHWFINISDYRGFDTEEGWRHAVAHGADLLMQLALNPKIDAEGLKLIVSAVGVQIAPEKHAYIHGESERLARPVLFAAARGAMSEAEWTDWLKAIATPKDAAVHASEAGLAWRHNANAFLQALYVNAVVGSDPADDVLRPGLEAALKAMP